MPSAVLQVKQRLEKLATYEASKPAQAITALALFRAAWGDDPDPWQADILHSTSKQVLMACSRQSGKSTTASVLAIDTAISKPQSLILLLSPSMRQSLELFQKAMQVYNNTQGLPAPVSETKTMLHLANGSRLISLPGKPETVRGFSAVSLLIVDEAAFVSDQLFTAVRPMLAVSQGRMVVMSTPFGKRGTFYNLWSGDNGWNKVRVTAYDIPRIPADFLREEQQALGPLFAQEYLGEFLDSETSLFSYEVIQAALDAGQEVEPWF